VSLEGVQIDDREIHAVQRVQILDLADGEVEERKAVSDFDCTLWDGVAAHRGAQPTVQSNNDEFVEKLTS
jgi:hypothetical protein